MKTVLPVALVALSTLSGCGTIASIGTGVGAMPLNEIPRYAGPRQVIYRIDQENWGQTRFSRNWKHNEQNQMTTAKILPTWDENLNAPPQARWDRGNVASPMPFEVAFWISARHAPNGTAELSRIKGFISSLPVHWTEGENIRFDYPSALVTQKDQPADHLLTNRAQVYARALADVQG